MNTPSPQARTTPLRTAVLVALAGAIAVAVAFAAAEVLLRIVPMPGIGVEPVVYDTETGGRFYPGAELLWRGAQGNVVRRRVNAFGFADVEHDSLKAPGTMRVAFFGDSYTEARQVPLADTFFRLIEKDLNALPATTRGGAEHVEVLAFGVPGRGALQSYIECRRAMRPLGLDMVVYVFCENDPADQVPGLVAAGCLPFPVLSADTFVVDNSFRERCAHKESRLYRAGQWFKAHSVLASTLVSRARLLRRHGLRAKRRHALDNAAIDVASRGDAENTPRSESDAAGGQIHPPTDDAGHLAMHTRDARGAHGPRAPLGTITHPSNLGPDSLVAHVWTLEARVIARWSRDVRRRGGQFVVLRIPRAESVREAPPDTDSWAPRLRALCDSLAIPLVDPAPWLEAAHRAGLETYYDHFTRSGHRATAHAFLAWWKQRVAAHEL